MIGDIQKILGADADGLLSHQCKTMAKENLHLPGPDFIDRIFAPTDRPTRVLVNLQQLYGSGRLAKTGYVSILPVDQGSNTPQVLRSLRIPCTSTPRTL
jgi:hypothetical protein